MICPICKKDFTPKRSDAKSCGSDACRKALQRQDKPVKSYYADIGPTEYFKTGIPEFDSITGFPKRSLSIVYGPEGAGKSTLMYNIIKALTDQAKVLYIDSEGGLFTERLEELGVEHDNLDIVRPFLLEDVYETILKGTEKYDLIIWDSVTATTYRAEVQGDVSDSNWGIRAKILNKLFRILPYKLREGNSTLITINQERPNMETRGTYIPGGKGQLYTSSQTIRLAKRFTSPTFTKDGELAGHWAVAEIKKSRVAAPGKKIEFKVYY